MGLHSRLSMRQRNEIIAAYANGGSPTKIGLQYGIGSAYVVMIYRRAKNPPKRVSEPVPPPPPKRKRKPKPPAILPQQIGSGRQTISGYLRLM